MRISALILGCSGLELTQTECEFFRTVQPLGFVLFGRNIDSPSQVKALVSNLKACLEHKHVPVLIDQEGGRVRRLRPPHWPEYHSAGRIGAYYMHNRERALRMTWLQSRLMARDLVELGINVNCLPVLDVPMPGGDEVIGDRAYSRDPAIVSAFGRSACKGLLEGGVCPVVKHIPGHGRAKVDSHKVLPRVDASRASLKNTDFPPFANLNDMPAAMTAHVVYEAIDPNVPATISTRVIDEIIRTELGFDGLLISDDLSMNALSGDFSHRTQSAFAAGCDIVLHCNGKMDEMQQIADAAVFLEGAALRRVGKVIEIISQPCANEVTILRSEFDGYCDAAFYAHGTL